MICLKNSFDCSKKVKDMALEERPREKMILNGPDDLSNAELLAILLRTGTKKRNAIELADYIIKKDLQGIRYLQDITIEELCEIDGIGISKATQIKAALELGIRISSAKPNRYKVKNPWDIYKYYMESLRYKQNEIFKVVLLNTKNEIITDVDVSVGTLNSSLVHPREVFKEAIKRSSNKMILIHNHPSGSIEPSKEDKSITTRLIKCGELIGIEVIDHIIIGDGLYFSFKENMII
ncbi:MAG: RadC family protein [Peptostreptococcaceae bacterium]